MPAKGRRRMNPTHLHQTTFCVRRFKWFRWPLKFTTAEKVCTCKEADRDARKMREAAIRNPEFVIVVGCDVRGAVKR